MSKIFRSYRDLGTILLVMPLAYFLSSGLISDRIELNINYFLTCYLSITLGIILGVGFSIGYKKKSSGIELLPFWMVAFIVGVVIGSMTIAFVEPHVTGFGGGEFIFAFLYAACTYSPKSLANDSGKNS